MSINLIENLNYKIIELGYKYIDHVDLIDDLMQIISDPNRKNILDSFENIICNKYKGNNNKYNEIVNEIMKLCDDCGFNKQRQKVYKENGIGYRIGATYSHKVYTLIGEVIVRRVFIAPKNKIENEKVADLKRKGLVIPRDDCFGVSRLPLRMTVNVMLLVAKLAVDLNSNTQVKEKLINDLGYGPGINTLMKAVNAVGSIVFKTEYEKAQEAYELFNNGKLNLKFEKNGCLYIDTDSLLVYERDKIDGGQIFIENKLGIVFSTDNIHKNVNYVTNEEIYKILKKEFTFCIGPPSMFKKFLLACALRNGYGQYKEAVFFTDGSTWIKNIKEELFQNTQLILDFYLLMEKISYFGKLNFPDSKKDYELWVERMSGMLRSSKFIDVINEVTKIEYTRNTLLDLASFLQNNIDYMDYKTYLKKGYIIGRAATQGVEKTVFQDRLGQAYMKYTKDSAQNTLTLLAKRENGFWHEEVEVPIRQFYGLE
ncbi:MAG: hypothetical protein LBD41_03610 [Clostridiales Family XIII bacterium]|jgi:hypothetical protein|nr:hypothetical protein [Clostridiales Family XIII bacterium]